MVVLKLDFHQNLYSNYCGSVTETIFKLYADEKEISHGIFSEEDLTTAVNLVQNFKEAENQGRVFSME